MLATAPNPPRPTRARYAAAPFVAVVTVAGVWIFGGLATNNFRASMALTAAWLLVAGAGAALVSWRSRPLRWIALPSFVVTALAVGGFLGWATFHDRVVHERVVDTRTAGATSLGRGMFVSGEHETTGRAEIVEVRRGERYLTITNLATSSGPDLRVYLTAESVGSASSAGDHVDLGALKGNIGDQQYELPLDVDVQRYRHVVIWCRAFSVEFGEAALG
jgi:hypothetical protein